jgi:hypothetical protein
MKKREIDSAALGGSAIAAVLTVALAKGPFDPVSFIIGVTLVALILAYELNNGRTLAQSIAFGAVLGLCSLLFLGFLVEWLVFHTPHDAPESKLSYTLIVSLWLTVAVTFVIVDIAWVQKARPSNDQGSFK